MLVESYLSHRQTRLSEKELQEITTYLLGNFPQLLWKEEEEKQLLEFMQQDKKNRDGRINFSLLNCIGEAVVDQIIGPVQIKEGLRFYRELT